MKKRYITIITLALVYTTSWAQESQDSLESVYKYLNLQEVVIKGGLPHTRLKGNAMITRIEGTPLAQSGDLGYNQFRQCNRFSTHKLFLSLIYRLNTTRSKYKRHRCRSGCTGKNEIVKFGSLGNNA